ncbi:sortase (surface protein transpeptidase) [Metabacillus crassostreae]|uniref:class F sortase n=1 Tax=Metabacillus crassostreae TaxID=929098 RepID=UPI00195D3C01|nr:class F sortase [Metabacillus crassostreae]MBM7604271.1 sortase (surface protein transpeptidase) [Metabacillus crassostreae]
MWRVIYALVFLVVFTECQQNDSIKESKMEDSTVLHEAETTEDPTSSVVKTENTQVKNDEPIIKDIREKIKPAEITIPAINVKAQIEEVGLLDNGQMGVPEDINQVGWFKEGVMPGEQGNAVLAGHVDSKTGPAIFYYLEKLAKGDEIIVADRDGKSLTFVVYDKKSYVTESAPVDKVFGFSYRSQLNLITCTGSFNREKGTHEERLVVYTVLKDNV